MTVTDIACAELNSEKFPLFQLPNALSILLAQNELGMFV